MMDRQRKFKAIRIGIMRSDEFGLLKGIMMIGERKLTNIVPTAATNGRDELYNPDFLFETISNGDKGVGFIIVHENMHKAARHMIVYQALHRKNARLTNMACDYWINDRIMKADPDKRIVEMPTDSEGKYIGLYDKKYEGWTVKRIFYDLLKEEEEQGGDDDSDGPQGEEQGQGSGQGQGDGGFDDHDWEGAQDMPKEEQDKLTNDVKEAIRQGQHAARKAGTGGLQDALGLGELVRPKVDWRVQLREFLNATCRKKERSTWRRPNRWFLHQDIIMPTLEGESIKVMVQARDASGSMWCEDRLGTVTGEMVSIAKMLDVDEIHVIDWDGKAVYRGCYNSDQIKDAPPIKEVVGGGGTNPVCVSDYLDKHNIKPDCIIVLTDGEVYGSWGNWKAPVLWAIANTRKITAPVGKTINID